MVLAVAPFIDWSLLRALRPGDPGVRSGKPRPHIAAGKQAGE